MTLRGAMLLFAASRTAATDFGPAPEVGIALAAGGSTGLVAGVCDLHVMTKLAAEVGRPMSEIAVGAASGGTLGKLLFSNLGDAGMKYPKSLEPADLTMSALNDNSDGPDGTPWYANILKQIPDKLTWKTVVEGLIAGGKGRDWFAEGLLELATKGYYKKKWSNLVTDSPFYAQVSLVPTSQTPLSLNPRDGRHPLKNPAQNLFGSEVDMSTGKMHLWQTDHANLNGATLPIVDAVAASSSFWAGFIMTGERRQPLKELLLMKTRLTGGGAEEASVKHGTEVYMADGGIMEPSGVVSLLRRKIKKLVVFLNCPEDLERTPAILGYLFGHNGRTDGGNVWAGADLLQVFPTNLWDQVYAGLTSNNVTARLQNVPVSANSYLGVESYTVDELLILSNQRSDTFFDEFANPRAVRKNVPEDFPLGVAMGMSNTEANVLCSFQHWKVKRNAAAIKEIIKPTSTTSACHEGVPQPLGCTCTSGSKDPSWQCAPGGRCVMFGRRGECKASTDTPVLV